jgi:hypothetical protein
MCENSAPGPSTTPLSAHLKNNTVRVVSEYFEGIMAARDGPYDER